MCQCREVAGERVIFVGSVVEWRHGAVGEKGPESRRRVREELRGVAGVSLVAEGESR